MCVDTAAGRIAKKLKLLHLRSDRLQVGRNFASLQQHENSLNLTTGCEQSALELSSISGSNKNVNEFGLGQEFSHDGSEQSFRCQWDTVKRLDVRDRVMQFPGVAAVDGLKK